MSINYIVVDNFYENPYDVRNFALTLEYKKHGVIPGKRSILPCITEEQKIKIEKIMYPFSGKIVNFEPDDTNGTFLYTTRDDIGWVHVDLKYRKWVAIVYLTPNAPIECGTALYRHKNTNKRFVSKGENNIKREEGAADLYNWDIVDNIGNVFNRIFIYQSNYYHNISDFFGKTISDGRLVQTFFFDTEK
jgi:hypothetical protein